MNLILPRYFNVNSIGDFIRPILKIKDTQLPEEVTIDFSKVIFIDPVGVTVLSNILEYLKKRRINFKFSNYKNNSEPIRFLDDSLFFLEYVGNKIHSSSTVRSTTLQLKKIEMEESYQWIETLFLPWIKREIGYEKKLKLEMIKVCLMEIFNNIRDHSGENIGCLFAQHFPNRGIVNIAISDFGVGIPFNVRKMNPSMKDSEAIKLAAQEGFSTKTNPQNRGAGLDILIKNTISHQSDKISIFSNYGILHVYKSKDGEDIIFKPVKNTLFFYPGTLLNIEVQTDLFIGDEEEEDFQW
ncbi:MAG: STAS domain-containing protein [Leptospiraceae bacterium]|nr:STAS domain-containing protein [Leptospiraceae bacterium]